MRVLQVPFHYYPDAVGGTEVYVSSLSRCFQAEGLDVEIAAPGDAGDDYLHDGIRVHRFPVTKTPADLAMLYGAGDALATREFARILDRRRPDLVHLHAMSPAVSLDAVAETKKREIPVVFTCHIPGITCPRGTLLHNGRQVCDGVWNLNRCTTCTLQARGLPIAAAKLISVMPAAAGGALDSRGFRGSVITAVRMRELQGRRHETLVKFFHTVDRVIAVSGWLREMLVANGIPATKVVLCRHGSSQMAGDRGEEQPRSHSGLRVAFLGRLNPTKGAHILVEAIRQLPQMPICLDIFGIVQDDTAYVDKLRGRIGNDSRIRLRNPLPNQDVVETLRSYDALAVPSQWMETGPLVVYDAFAAGIPVIGSRRGGLIELVTHERDGLLVEPDNPSAWAKTLERLAGDRALRQRLREGVRPPRPMSAVALEMIELYAGLASHATAAQHG